MVVGEIWEYITDGISFIFESLSQIPELLSGAFTEVNFSGWLILTIIGEAILWGFWYYTKYSIGKESASVASFMNLQVMLIATVVTPIICYFFAWRNRE